MASKTSYKTVDGLRRRLFTRISPPSKKISTCAEGGVGNACIAQPFMCEGPHDPHPLDPLPVFVRFNSMEFCPDIVLPVGAGRNSTMYDCACLVGTLTTRPINSDVTGHLYRLGDRPSEPPFFPFLRNVQNNYGCWDGCVFYYRGETLRIQCYVGWGATPVTPAPQQCYFGEIIRPPSCSILIQLVASIRLRDTGWRCLNGTVLENYEPGAYDYWAVCFAGEDIFYYPSMPASGHYTTLGSLNWCWGTAPSSPMCSPGEEFRIGSRYIPGDCGGVRPPTPCGNPPLPDAPLTPVVAVPRFAPTVPTRIGDVNLLKLVTGSFGRFNGGPGPYNWGDIGVDPGGAFGWSRVASASVYLGYRP